MTPEELSQMRWMKSEPVPLEFDSGRIDVEAGILHDVVMAQEGDAKGHGIALEAEFVKDLVAYDQKHYRRIGLKNRFGHPGASNDTLGSQMGKFFNFRTREVGGVMQAIADLHLLEASNVSPTQPNMKEWMLQMAQESPDFVMQSIVFRPGRYYQKLKNGSKKYVWEYEKTKGEDGNTYDKWVNSDKALGKVFVEFGSKGEHYYTDTVEAGAATDALFSSTANPHLFVSQATIWLEEHPEIKTFAQQYPEKVQTFVKSLGITPQRKTMNLKEILFGKDKTEETTLSAAEVTELRDKMELAAAANATDLKELSDLRAEVATLKADKAKAENDLKEATDKVTALEDKAAESHTKGPREGEQPDKEEKSFQNDPITAKARESYARRMRK